MTLTAESVVALVCAECEADLRGAAKVLDGQRYLCSTCALRLEYRRVHGLQLEPRGASHG